MYILHYCLIECILYLAFFWMGRMGVTKRNEDYGIQDSTGKKKILRLPAFAFLYLLGNAEKHRFRGVK